MSLRDRLYRTIELQLLVLGTPAPAQVAAAMQRLARVFATGLIVSPSEDAIPPDSPPANIEVKFAEVRSL